MQRVQIKLRFLSIRNGSQLNAMVRLFCNRAQDVLAFGGQIQQRQGFRRMRQNRMSYYDLICSHF